MQSFLNEISSLRMILTEIHIHKKKKMLKSVIKNANTATYHLSWSSTLRSPNESEKKK